MDEQAQVAAAVRGDRAAFEGLVQTTLPASYALATRLVGEGDAPDVVQDAYIKAWRSIKKFRGDSAFATWMYRIVANTALTHRSRRKRFREVLDELGETPQTPASETEVPIDPESNLGRALMALPDGIRATVVLVDVYGFGHDEVAHMLHCSEGAVRVRLHRGRAALRTAITGGTYE